MRFRRQVPYGRGRAGQDCPAQPAFTRSQKRESRSASGMCRGCSRCWATRPVSVITTASSVVMDTGMISTWRSVDLDSDGEATTATCPVICASRRAARCRVSSRLADPDRKLLMPRRWASDNGATVASRSTKYRYPFSVGMRPADVWGWVRYPSSSRAAMSLRIVAELTPRSWSRASAEDPTGSWERM